MQIPSSSSYFGSSATRTTSNAGAASPAGSGAAASSVKGGLASKSTDVVQEFLDYARMDPMARLRANILKSMGLTEDDLKNMPPEQQKAVEQKIEQLIREQLEKNAGKTGQVVNISA
jgi:hypothetical protein